MSSVMARTPTVTRHRDFMAAAAEEGHKAPPPGATAARLRAGAGGRRPPRPALPCRRAGRSRRSRRASRPAGPRAGAGGVPAVGSRCSAAGGGVGARGGSHLSPGRGGCDPGLAGPGSVHQVERRTWLTRREKNVCENNLGLFLLESRVPAGAAEISPSAVEEPGRVHLSVQQASLKGFLEDKQKTSYSSARWLGGGGGELAGNTNCH